jgi:hypothetical protein
MVIFEELDDFEKCPIIDNYVEGENYDTIFTYELDEKS